MPQTTKVAQTAETAAPQSRVTDTVQENTSSLEHTQFQARMRGMNIPPNGSRDCGAAVSAVCATFVVWGIL